MQKIGKEVKIGLGVIGLLVAVFGFILVRRLTRPDDLPVASANSQPAAAGAASSPGKPIVVSATDAARPTDAGGDASSPRSLFTTDTGNEGRGSMMPEANHTAADHDAPSNSLSAAPAANPSSPGAKNGSEAGRSLFTSGVPRSSSHSKAADSDTNPADRFRQRNAPSDPTNSIAGGASSPSNDFASRATAAPIASAPPTGLPSTETPPSAAFAAPATPPPAQMQAVSPVAASIPSVTPPSAAPDPNLPLGGSSADPFQQKSANLSALDRQSNAAAPPPASSLSSSASAGEANPLRHSHDSVGSMMPPAATAGLAPPPITSSAINVPDGPVSSATPGEAGRSPGVPALAASQPADAPPPVATSAPKPGQYVVQPDDNYWAISEKVYGTGGYFKAVYEHNRRQRAQSERLQVGDVLELPPAATLEQMYPDLCPRSASASEPATAAVPAARPGTRTYSVADGDTLYEIARHELGSPSRWGEIYQLNHDQLGNDFSYLRPGTQLLLPTDGSAESVARDPNAAMQR